MIWKIWKRSKVKVCVSKTTTFQVENIGILEAMFYTSNVDPIFEAKVSYLIRVRAVRAFERSFVSFSIKHWASKSFSQSVGGSRRSFKRRYPLLFGNKRDDEDEQASRRTRSSEFLSSFLKQTPHRQRPFCMLPLASFYLLVNLPVFLTHSPYWNVPINDYEKKHVRNSFQNLFTQYKSRN